MASKEEIERRKKKNVASKTGQLQGLGVLSSGKDKDGSTVQLQPTILSRPNVLGNRAFQKGNLGGGQLPTSNLADMAMQANNAENNQTESGTPASAARYPVPQKKKKASGFGATGVL